MILTILLILLGIILLILTWLLVCPVTLHIDTSQETFQVSMKGVFTLALDTASEEFVLGIRTPFFRKLYYPFRDKSGTDKRTKPTHPEKRKTRTRGRDMNFQKLRRLLRTFKVEDFRCSIDTGDYVQNALLVPVFQVMSQYRDRVSVNFNGEFYLRLVASNSLWRLGTAYLIY
jgi:hypothetical protein